MINETNCTYVYVGNVANGFADDAVVNVDSMLPGSVVIVKTGENKATTGAIAGSTSYQIVNKLSNGEILRSPEFKLENLRTSGKAAYGAPKEQVSFIGYDGTTISGLGTITQGNSYIVGLWLNHTKGIMTQQGEVKHISAYATDATQVTVAKNLMLSHIKNFSPIREKYPSILCDRIQDSTTLTTLTASTAIKLTHGSKVVSFNTVALAASTGSVAKDAVISIPSYNGKEFKFTATTTTTDYTISIGEYSITANNSGTAATAAGYIVSAINNNPVVNKLVTASVSNADVTIVYKEGFYALPPVVAQSTTAIAVSIENGDKVPVAYTVSKAASTAATFELDIPWQGPTGYVVSGTTSGTTVGTVTATKWGLKFTGVPQPFNPQVDYPVQVNFDIATDSFGDNGKEYKAVVPNFGQGTYVKVAELEAYAQGNDNWYRTSAYPATEYRREALKGNGYNVITATFSNAYTSAATGVTVTSPWTAVIAVSTNVASYNSLDTVLKA